MEIIHRFSVNSSGEGVQLSDLDALGVPHEFVPLPAINNRDKPGLIIFEASENHPQWIGVQQLAARWRCTDIVRTEFTSSELKQATTLVIGAQWHHGYPMPDHDAGYLKTTYGGTGCTSCGIGLSQKAPFSMQAEPKWGRRHLMRLNWVTDEIFVSLDTYRNVFRAFDVPCTEVLHFKTLHPLETVVQLCIPQTAVLADLPKYDEICSSCGIGKYHWPVRGYFPRLDRTEKLPIYKTLSDFGSGGSAGKAIVVSQELYSCIMESRLRGCYFQPVESQVLSKCEKCS